ncbi:hypothetical protein [Collimonas sp. PA-H2]|uniref:hypothetical protein n=1 Tax=Collimonas sp. PA-H2 TaxID=1881062 RepID=UPI000BF5E4DD|nr:hypothetical protein [Collimonas sp. PA-H2]
MRTAFLKLLRTIALILGSLGVYALIHKGRGDNWTLLLLVVLMILSICLLFNFRDLVKIIFSIDTLEGEHKILMHTCAVILAVIFYFAVMPSDDAPARISPWIAAILGLSMVYLFNFLWWLILELPFSNSEDDRKRQRDKLRRQSHKRK